MEHPPSFGATWIRGPFDSSKAARGYDVSMDGLTATLAPTGSPYHTVQSSHPLAVNGAVGENRYYFQAEFKGLVGGIGFSQLNSSPSRVNIYNEKSFLLSGYGDLYCLGGSKGSYSANVSRSVGTRYGCLLDMDKGFVQFWVDGVDSGPVHHESLTRGEWYVTVTFGKGAAGSSFELL